MPTLMVLLVWLVAGVTLLVWWEIAQRVTDAVAELGRRAARRRENPSGPRSHEQGVGGISVPPAHRNR